eukprot:SM000406S15596  [mRNA]  locus=s406:42105:44737:+ [translate_table: standard]
MSQCPHLISSQAVAAAKGMVDNLDLDGEPGNRSAGGGAEPADGGGATGGSAEPALPPSEGDRKRLAALDCLDGASKDTMLGQGLKVVDESVESLAHGALTALNSAWKGSVTFVHKAQHSAEALAHTIQEGNLSSTAAELAPGLVQSSKGLASKGMQLLEFVGKETLDILAQETGIILEEDDEQADTDRAGEVEPFAEEVSFDRCFYIYGGPEHLEELEALANHYMLLCSRAQAKMADEERRAFDEAYKHLQHALTLGQDEEMASAGEDDQAKGKAKEEAGDVVGGTDVQALRDASISRAAEMASSAGTPKRLLQQLSDVQKAPLLTWVPCSSFAASLPGMAAPEVVNRTLERLEALRAEGVHRLSELCSLCLLQLLQLGNMMLATADGADGADKASHAGEEADKGSAGTSSSARSNWAEEVIAKGKTVQARAQAMTDDIEAVLDGYLTGISDVAEACRAATGQVEAGGKDSPAKVQEQQASISASLESDGSTAISRIQDGLQKLAHFVLATGIKGAEAAEIDSKATKYLL